MTISGIRPYAGFYEYNSIKANELRAEQIAATQEASSVEAEEVSTETQSAAIQTPAPEQNFTAFDYAQNYRSDETYELKGKDCDLASLDMQKAISDLDKDQVLQQYQFFVGDKDSVTAKMTIDPLERMIRREESFTL
uniref:hypothetical protein n=1 Tax=Agathobacter sp. TaxID=2021311 RepID=UPI003FEDB206